MNILNRFKPGVDKNGLNLLAGLMWSGVGIMLTQFAAHWLTDVSNSWRIFLILSGILLAFCIYRFGFSKFARKNINRIQDYQEKRICLFAFQAWTSYPLVAVMIAMGIFLRLYSPFPKWMLAILYLGIGGSLFMASFQYYLRLFPGEPRAAQPGSGPSRDPF